MRIGVVGLGGIAQKAYLPTYSKIRNQAEFIFATRNSETRKQIQERYDFSIMVQSIEELLEQKMEACFIHVATLAHYHTAKMCLTRGIHVFMDKPISECLAETQELYRLAAENQCVFMIGFNRRFAPMVDSLQKLPDKRLLLLQKNRTASKQKTAFAIYDLFLHLVDTAVYLLEDDIQLVESKIIEQEGFVELAYLHLATHATSAMLTMDFNSGANTEIYQVTSPKKTLVLYNLTKLEILEATNKTVKGFGDWETTLFKRGFEQMVTEFILACQKTEKAVLRQENVLLSHELCDIMLKKHYRHEM